MRRPGAPEAALALAGAAASADDAAEDEADGTDDEADDVEWFIDTRLNLMGAEVAGRAAAEAAL